VTKQGRSAIATTGGNEDCHVILRGGRVPNYDAVSIDATWKVMSAAGLSSRIMIDCSHGNSSKRPENQPLVAESIAQQIEAGERRIGGVMLESHLVGGRQDLVAGRPLVYGQSITDGCIDWQTSVPILERLATAVGKRRRSHPLE
jgi:3-deoxy-7-phosphoheptulonate synthase